MVAPPLHAPERAQGAPRWAAFAVRLAALWILVGALFKLFLGTPADLPPVVLKWLGDDVLTYQLAIAIELAVVALAWLRPAQGFWLVAFTYLVFEAVLATQLASGAESCGCFGAKVPMPPLAMVAIDTLLLLFLLAGRPWRLSGGAPWWLTLLFMALGAALPFLYSREVSAPPPPAAGGAAAGPAATGSTPPKAALGRGFVEFDVESWVGKTIDATPLAQWVEGGIDALPFEGPWVLYRSTCDHCAKHLEHLAQNPPDAPFLTLVRLKEPHDTEANRVVQVLPEGDNVLHAACPDSVDYLLTTPGELWLEAGVIVRAEEGVEVE